MSLETLDTRSNYLKLVYLESHTVLRPASTFYTQYDYSVQYSATNYNAMILGYFSAPNGRRYPCPSTVNPNLLPTDLAVATIFATAGTVSIGLYGQAGDATAYNVPVDLYVLLNSVLEA